MARLASTMPGQGWDSRGQSFEASHKLVHVLGSERSERAPSLPRRRRLREPDPSRRSAAADRAPTGVCASSRPACAAQTTAARTETFLPAASLPSVPPSSFSDHQLDRLAEWSRNVSVLSGSYTRIAIDQFLIHLCCAGSSSGTRLRSGE